MHTLPCEVTEQMSCGAVASTPVHTRANAENIRFHMVMALIVAGCFVFCRWMRPAQGGGSLSAIPHCTPLIAAAGYLGWAGYRRLSGLLSRCLWLVAFMLVTDPLLEIAGSTRYALIDQVLARYDILSTGSIVRWVQAHHAEWLSLSIYRSFLPLFAGAMLLPGLLGHATAGYRFVIAGALGALITIATFAVMPATGPWTVEDYQPTAVQLETTRQIAALKAHHAVQPMSGGGVVSFPSFHTVLAILSAFALWPLRWIRWIAVPVAIAICISTVTTGWHYGLDVIAGAVVALISQRAATEVLR